MQADENPLLDQIRYLTTGTTDLGCAAVAQVNHTLAARYQRAEAATLAQTAARDTARAEIDALKGTHAEDIARLKAEIPKLKKERLEAWVEKLCLVWCCRDWMRASRSG